MTAPSVDVPAFKKSVLGSQFASCTESLQRNIEQALKLSRSSAEVQQAFEDIARHLDDALFRLEIWASDIGQEEDMVEKDPKFRVTTDHFLETEITREFEDVAARSQEVGTELVSLQEKLKHLPPKLAESVPVEVTLRIENINSSIASSVRNLTGLANLISMERAATHGRGPVHEFRRKMLDYFREHPPKSTPSEVESETDSEHSIQGNGELTFQAILPDSAMDEHSSQDADDAGAEPPSILVDRLSVNELVPSKRSADNPMDDSKLHAKSEISTGKRKESFQGADHAFTSTMIEDSHRAWSEHNLLSFDSGGIRSYWSLLAFREIMLHVAEIEEVGSSFYPAESPERYPDFGEDGTTLPTDRRYLPCHYFDFIGGDGFGGIVAIMLGRLRMTIAECVSEFEYLLGKAGSGKLSFALGSGTKFSAVCLDDVMEDIVRKYGSYCDNEDYMNFLEKRAFICYPGVCQTFVLARTEYDKRGKIKNTPYLFRSYDVDNNQPSSVPDIQSRSEHMQNRRASEYGRRFSTGVATVALTGYPRKISVFQNTNFSAYSPHVANYATTIGIREIEERYGKGTVGIIVSIGDGEGSGSQINKTAKYTGQSSEESYYRFDLSGISTSATSVDKWEPEHSSDESRRRGSKTLRHMSLIFLDWSKRPDVRLQFRNCAEKLVQKRRLRTLDASKWERYTLASKFVCPIQGCGGKRFLYRDDFEHHLKDSYYISNEEAVNLLVNFGRRTPVFEATRKRNLKT